MSKDDVNSFIAFALAHAVQGTMNSNYESIRIPKPSRDKIIWYSDDGPMRIHKTPKLTKAEKKQLIKQNIKENKKCI